MYNFIALAYERVYHLPCNEIYDDAVEAVVKSVVPFCTIAAPLGPIASGGDTAVAVFF